VKIYVDLDDVLADTVSLFLVIARKRFDRYVEYEEVHSFNLAKSLNMQPGDYQDFMKCVHEPDVLLSIVPIAGAREAVTRWLQKGDQVIVATGRPSHTGPTCLQWLSENGFSGTELLFVDKYSRPLKTDPPTVVALDCIPSMGFDVLIEDSPEVATYLAQKGCKVSLVRRPWNQHITVADGYSAIFVADAWEQVCARVEELRR
jgi:hypothetical protein